MKHARSDYNRIQDPAGLIADDEPVFLIRAKDAAGPLTVLMWAQEASRLGAAEEIVQSAIEHSLRMIQWQVKNGKQVPDMPASCRIPFEAPE